MSSIKDPKKTGELGIHKTALILIMIHSCSKRVVDKHVLLGGGQQAMDTVLAPEPAVGRSNPSVQVIELKLWA